MKNYFYKFKLYENTNINIANFNHSCDTCDP